MVDYNDDKPGGEHGSTNDSGELLKSLFRDELNAIVAENKKETASKTPHTSSPPQKPKSPARGKGAGRKKVGPETGTDDRKIVKHYPVSEVQGDKRRKVASNTGTSLKKEVDEKTGPDEGIKTEELKEGKVGFGGNLPLTAGKLKGTLVSFLLVAGVAFLLSSLGVVDFGRLLGSSEPARKAGRRTSVARKPIVKESSPAAPMSSQKTIDKKAADQTIAPERRRVGRNPSEATFSRARRRIINRRTEPVSSPQEPTAVQEHLEPSASTEKPVIPGQKDAVPVQLAEPAPPAQELPVSKTPPEPVALTQEPLVAKEPTEPSAPKAKPDVTKAPSHSAGQTPEKAALGKEIVFPAKRDKSYPYSVYLGSYKSRERAEKAISKYRIKGLSPHWVKIDLGDKGTWYRVFSGYFQEREQANEFIKEKQMTDSESRHTKYANLIGLFAFQKEIEEQKLRLSKLGYSTYVIPDRNGESLLYVGAFYLKARAQRQHEELASKGVHSQVVER
ncbi:MAG: SPOR domain-containing protein [Deltaproteobacteria bacterium]|jgi:cell division protein FtsN